MHQSIASFLSPRRFTLLCLLAACLSSPAFAQKGALDPDAQPAAAGPKSAHKDDPAGRAAWFMRGRRIKGESSALLL